MMSHLKLWKYAMMHGSPDLIDAAIDAGARDLQACVGADYATFNECRDMWVARFGTWKCPGSTLMADEELRKIRAIIRGDRDEAARALRAVTSRRVARTVGSYADEGIIRAELSDDGLECQDAAHLGILREVIIGAIKARRSQLARELIAKYRKHPVAVGQFSEYAIAIGDTALYEETLDHPDDTISVSIAMYGSAFGGDIKMFEYLYSRMTTEDKRYVATSALTGAVRSGNVELFREIIERVKDCGIFDDISFRDRRHRLRGERLEFTTTIESLILTIAKCAGCVGSLAMGREVLDWARAIDKSYEALAVNEMAHEAISRDNYWVADLAINRARGTADFATFVNYLRFLAGNCDGTCCSTILIRKYV